MQGKIFGIGLNKTGTRSLARATRVLGFRTLHKGDDATSALVDRAHDERVPLLTHVGDRYHAYFDVEALVHRFRELDQQYPDSRFILTTRDEAAWLASREKHVVANQERAARGVYTGSWLTVDVEAWRAEREKHHRDVREHFADRPRDLLELDLTRGDGWSALAPFLDRAEPAEPFPWENRDGAGTYAPRIVGGGQPRGFVRLALAARRLRTGSR